MLVPRRRLFAALVLATTVAIAACGPGSPSGPSTPGNGGGAVEVPRVKKTLTAVVGYPIIAFASIGHSPMGGNMVSWLELHTNGLVTSDTEGRPIPQLARERPSLDAGTMVVQSDGRMTTRWSLRPDATWHDGTPVSARDIALGVKVFADPDLPVADRSAAAFIESAEVVDPNTVVLVWKQPYYLADSLGPHILSPLPAHILEDEYAGGDKERFRNLPYWTSEYIHAGPFRLQRYEPGTETAFEAYEQYFLGRPKVDTVLIKEILDRNAAYAAILAGEVDISIELMDGEQAISLADQWEATGRGRIIPHYGATFFFAVQFAPEFVGAPEQLDPRIRRALYFALDRRGLAELAYGRPIPEGEAKSILPPNHALYPYVKDVYATRANDLQRAMQLFAEVGWTRGPDGFLTNIAGRRLPLEVRSTREALATAAANMWRQSGVDSSVLIPPPARRQDAEYAQTYPGVDLAGSGEGDRIISRIDGTKIPTARTRYVGTNRGHYDDPRVTGLIDRYRSSLQEVERGHLMRQIADIVGEELPILLGFYNPVFATVARDVRALEDIRGGHVGAGYFGAYTRTAHLWEKR